MSENLPKVILFQEDEKALNYRYKLEYQLNQNISIKSLEYDLEKFNNSAITLEGSQPTNDSMYYLHPYKTGVYVHESLGEFHFLKEKMELYRRVGALLGAKSISTKVILTKSEKIDIDIDGKVRVKVINAGVDLNIIKKSGYSEALEISEKYELQSNFNLNKNIDELKNMIKNFNLNHESDIVSLINARDSRSSGTALLERKVKSEISSEYNNLLKVSAQLSSPIFNVDTNFKKSLEEMSSITLEMEFIF